MRYYSSLICPELTERQVQIAILVAQFKTNKEIARELGIVPSVVSEHISNMLKELGCVCRTQLVVWMLKRGLITLDEIEMPDIPSVLCEFALQEQLGAHDVEMLSRISYNGLRPETVEDYRFIYESIKRSIPSRKRG